MEIYRQHPQLRELFQFVEQTCAELRGQGFKAYLAGGCVRDFLLGRTPSDFDVATDATPDQVEKLFPKTLAIGKQFGVIVVLQGDLQIEVATFRKDGVSENGRHPTSVDFCDAKEDALRRDFTVNALFYDLEAGKVIDYVAGLQDLKAQVLRAVGDPGLRFREDHLRILRAVRFTSQLGFIIEPVTLTAISENSELASKVSGERIQMELGKLILGSNFEKAFELLVSKKLLESLTGMADWVWKNPKDLFARGDGSLEDRWLRFFMWMAKAHTDLPSLVFFESLAEKWKFSKALKQKTLKGLQWLYEDRPWVSHRLGELLELSFDPNHLSGLLEKAHERLAVEEEKSFSQFQDLRKAIALKPQPLIKTADLPGYQGVRLGQALKISFWLQLENPAFTKEQILQSLQAENV